MADFGQGGNSQNFLRQILRIFVTLGLKILGLIRLKVYLKQISFKADVNYKNINKL